MRIPVPISNPNCSAPHWARCWTSSGTSRAFSGTAKRHRPSSRASTASAARPSSPARTGAGIRACGSAPSTAATHATRSAPSRSPPPNQRRTGLPRQTDALSRNAELWLQVEPELANPAARPAATASSGAVATAPAAGAPAHPAEQRERGRDGVEGPADAVTGRRPGTSAGESSSLPLSRPRSRCRPRCPPRPRRPVPPGSGWPPPAGERTGGDGDAGVLGAVVEHRGGDRVGAAEALPPPGVAAVTVGGQPRRLVVHATGAVRALAVVAVLARVGAAPPSAVADRLAALPPVVVLLVVLGGLAGAVLGAVRRLRSGLAARQVPVERDERGRRHTEHQCPQDGASAGAVAAQPGDDGAGPRPLRRGGRGGDLLDAGHTRLTSLSGVRARATSSRNASGRSVSA